MRWGQASERDDRWFALLNAYLHLTDTVAWSQLYYEGWAAWFAKLTVYLDHQNDPRYAYIPSISRRSKGDYLPWRQWLDVPARALWPHGRPTSLE